MGVEFEDGGFLGGAVGPFEEDLAGGIISEGAFSAEGGALDVSGKVAEGCFSAADGLELDVPVLAWAEGVALVGGEFCVEVCKTKSRRSRRPTAYKACRGFEWGVESVFPNLGSFSW